MADQAPYRVPPGFGDDGRALRSNLSGGNRKDYGPKGCAGIVLAPVVLVAALLLRGGRR